MNNRRGLIRMTAVLVCLIMIGTLLPVSGLAALDTPVLTGAKAAADVDQTLDQKAEAPNTFDFGIISAVAAVVSLGGFALTKKKH